MPCVKLCKATCNGEKITFYFVDSPDERVKDIAKYYCRATRPSGMDVYIVVKIPSGVDWDVGDLANTFMRSKYCEEFFKRKGIMTGTLVGKAGWVVLCDSPVEVWDGRVKS